jgi:hypothetical protein
MCVTFLRFVLNFVFLNRGLAFGGRSNVCSARCGRFNNNNNNNNNNNKF